MKVSIKVFLFVCMLSVTFLSFAQSPKKQEIIKKALSAENIDKQFEILVAQSPSFQNFKNIKNSNLRIFTKNFKDSLVATNKKFSAANLKIENQITEIEKLNAIINKTNSDLTKVSEEKNSIGLFGTRMSKTTYNTILWSIILSLLAATLFFLFKYRNSNSVTKNANSSLLEIEQEYETHKKNSLEREQVLRRKLQDELNKHRNVK